MYLILYATPPAAGLFGASAAQEGGKGASNGAGEGEEVASGEGWVPTDEEVKLDAAKIKGAHHVAEQRLRKATLASRQYVLDIVGELSGEGKSRHEG